MRQNAFHSISNVRQQRGVVLLLALIMLVSMTLAGLALYRQIGTGLIVARNLTFKRTAAVAADLGVEAGRAWLTATTTTAAALLAAQSASGNFYYYPAWCYTPTNQGSSGSPTNCGSATSDFDPTTYDWTHSAVATASDGSGNEIRYVIHRLCALPGGMNIDDTPGQRCASIGRAPAGQTQNVAGYGGTAIPIINMPFYRVTARVQDRMNTQIYTQAILF